MLVQSLLFSAAWPGVLAQVSQQSTTGQTAVKVFSALGILVALVAVLAIAAWLIRRLTIGSDSDVPLSGGFSLSDLRRMHREGQLTDAEFDRAKRLLAARELERIEADQARREQQR